MQPDLSFGPSQLFIAQIKKALEPTIAKAIEDVRRADGGTFVMTFNECYRDMSEAEAAKVKATFAEAMPGERLLLLPPGTDLKPIAPYRLDETLPDGTKRSISFQTNEELQQFLSRDPRKVWDALTVRDDAEVGTTTEELAMQDRRLKTLHMSAELLLGILTGLGRDENGMTRVPFIQSNPVPDDALLCGIEANNERDEIVMRLSHGSFPVVHQGNYISRLDPPMFGEKLVPTALIDLAMKLDPDELAIVLRAAAEELDGREDAGGYSALCREAADKMATRIEPLKHPACVEAADKMAPAPAIEPLKLSDESHARLKEEFEKAHSGPGNAMFKREWIEPRVEPPRHPMCSTRCAKVEPVHYAVVAFRALCGADLPNQRTTMVPGNVTCPTCRTYFETAEDGGIPVPPHVAEYLMKEVPHGPGTAAFEEHQKHPRHAEGSLRGAFKSLSRAFKAVRGREKIERAQREQFARSAPPPKSRTMEALLALPTMTHDRAMAHAEIVKKSYGFAILWIGNRVIPAPWVRVSVGTDAELEYYVQAPGLDEIKLGTLTVEHLRGTRPADVQVCEACDRYISRLYGVCVCKDTPADVVVVEEWRCVGGPLDGQIVEPPKDRDAGGTIHYLLTRSDEIAVYAFGMLCAPRTLHWQRTEKRTGHHEYQTRVLGVERRRFIQPPIAGTDDLQRGSFTANEARDKRDHPAKAAADAPACDTPEPGLPEWLATDQSAEPVDERAYQVLP